MIVDLDTQVWMRPNEVAADGSRERHRQDSDPWYLFDASPSAHDDAMGCIDLAVVLGFKSAHLGTEIPAEEIAAFVRLAPHRRIGFAGIDPMDEGAVDAIDHAISLGLVGIVLAPAAQSFHPTHSRAMDVYDRCQKAGIPILVKHARHPAAASTLDYDRPALFDEVARSFPRLRLVIGSLGYPWIDETLVMVQKHEHVYTDISGIVSRPWRLYNALVNAFEYDVLNKVLFASGFPYDAPKRAIERLYSLNSYSHGTDLPSIPRQKLKAMVERDTLSCLNLDRPEGVSISRGIAHDQPAAEIAEYAGDPMAQGESLSEILDRSSGELPDDA